VNASEIRKSFLGYFEREQHKIVPSSSLVPHNDPTLFFTNAGMVQFKDLFTGKEAPSYKRAVSSQRCLRVSGKHNDLDNVGRTPRHHTLFEMLGNFSFGDYFKADAIRFAWDLLTGTWKIDPDRLWVTIFEEDDEAHAIWHEKVGVPTSRIQRLGAKENFWSMGPVGPCGPCSEIHYDHGARYSTDPSSTANPGPASEDPRYVEIWNLVFMQFEQHEDGSRTALPKPSIDTGMGLERVSAVLQGVFWNYETDLFQPLMRKASELAGVKPGKSEESDTALRVISDHSRAAAFLVGDGVMPSNEERGYVLRRIMRRGIRFGTKLGLQEPFLHKVVSEVITHMSDAYPQLSDRRAFIEQVVLDEELRFQRTLSRGMRLLDAQLSEGQGQLPGAVAFELFDTYGFPLDLTELIAEERGKEVDTDGFRTAMEQQKARSRAGWKGSGQQAVSELWHQLHTAHGDTAFVGYDHDHEEGQVLALVRVSGDSGQEHIFTQVDRLAAGEKGILLLDQTPFYAESGGQVGDAGSIGGFHVTETQKAAGLYLHHGEATEPIEVGQRLLATVDAARRDRTRRNHTATHLLHAALRKVLGPHVTQKGSLVAPDRLRFDFAHPKPLSADELRRIEEIVNAEILHNHGVDTALDDLEQAVAKGAMALFGEKYDARVRVVSVPGFSTELCGGTHVRRTGDIGLFRILSEAGVAAGVRRIEAQTGTGALALVHEESQTLLEAARKLKTEPARLVEAIGKLQEDRKSLERELAELKRGMAKAAAGDLVQKAQDVNGIRVLAAEFDGDLREQADRLRDQLGSSLVVLLARKGDKVQMLAAASKDVAGSRIHAGKVIEAVAPLVGGRGGGRPDMAQAGGADPSGIAAAVQRVYSYAREVLG
jgi:alanyl-tRNA synthetase